MKLEEFLNTLDVFHKEIEIQEFINGECHVTRYKGRLDDMTYKTFKFNKDKEIRTWSMHVGNITKLVVTLKNKEK